MDSDTRSPAVEGAEPRSSDSALVFAVVPIGVAVNLALGTIVRALHAPVYLDATGTIAVTVLIGFRAGALAGVLSFLIGGVTVNPVLPWFSGTQVAIAAYAYYAGRLGAYKTLLRTVLAGLGLGVVAGVVSAPVIVYLFGGVTGSGASLVVAYLLATGHGLVKSVLYSGLASEPVDKLLQTLLAVWILRGLPRSLVMRFPSPSLAKNGFGGAPKSA
jgi:energy-coupling factor transport system substrate-specific component